MGPGRRARAVNSPASSQKPEETAAIGTVFCLVVASPSSRPPSVPRATDMYKAGGGLRPCAGQPPAARRPRFVRLPAARAGEGVRILCSIGAVRPSLRPFKPLRPWLLWPPWRGPRGLGLSAFVRSFLPFGRLRRGTGRGCRRGTGDGRAAPGQPGFRFCPSCLEGFVVVVVSVESWR